MEWRVTYFVRAAEREPGGWLVKGEPGLGAPRVGDRFDWVLHQDDGVEERDALQVAEVGADWLRVTGGAELALRAEDILGGETER